MYFKPYLAVTALVLVILLVGQGEAQGTFTTKPPVDFKCYTCTNCKEPFDRLATGVELRICSANEFYCFKFTHPDKKIDRGCTRKEHECRVAGKDCLTCNDKPGCNSGLSLSPAFNLLISVTIIGAIVSGSVWRGYQ